MDLMFNRGKSNQPLSGCRVALFEDQVNGYSLVMQREADIISVKLSDLYQFIELQSNRGSKGDTENE